MSGQGSAFAIKGWCPGALQPMESADGWVVRLRPPGARLAPAQADGVARAALRHGNGLIELTARANLQLRGVTRQSHPPLVAELAALGLVDADVAAERRRNLLVTPFRAAPHGAEIAALAAGIEAALAGAPELPGKFGFAIDAGSAPVLSAASADIRLERSPDGRLLLRPDGARLGRAVSAAEAPDAAMALAAWFARSGAAAHGRMARCLAVGMSLPGPGSWILAPAPPSPPPRPGPHRDGFLVGAALGQLSASALSRLAALGAELRLTPWRMLLAVGVRGIPEAADLVTDPHDPILQVTACAGAPSCPQALAATRPLARALAPHVPPGAHLHVSGCAKGCARPSPAAVTLRATASGFDLVRDGTAAGTSVLSGLAEAALLARPGSIFGAP